MVVEKYSITFLLPGFSDVFFSFFMTCFQERQKLVPQQNPARPLKPKRLRSLC